MWVIGAINGMKFERKKKFTFHWECRGNESWGRDGCYMHFISPTKRVYMSIKCWCTQLSRDDREDQLSTWMHECGICKFLCAFSFWLSQREWEMYLNDFAFRIYKANVYVAREWITLDKKAEQWKRKMIFSNSNVKLQANAKASEVKCERIPQLHQVGALERECLNIPGNYPRVQPLLDGLLCNKSQQSCCYIKLQQQQRDSALSTWINFNIPSISSCLRWCVLHS